MAKVKADEKSSSLIIEGKEFDSMGFPRDKEMELIKVEEGVWVITQKSVPEKKEEKSQEITKIDETEQKIIGYLREKPFKDRIEGNFERILSKEELLKFRQMLKEGKVEKYKSNPKYKKAVYQARLPEANRKFENVEKGIEEFSLEKDGFIVVKNEQRAKMLSEQLAEKVKAGEVMGTRSFEGTFYIIDSTFYNEKSGKVLDKIRELRNASLETLSRDLSLTPTVVRIICTFLNEEGQILEKRKEFYQYID